jgi:transcriptional regulator with XRE-family HTH domain
MFTPERLFLSQGYTTPFGNLLRELRIAQGLKQSELGKAVSISGSAISKFETGERMPPRDITELLDTVLQAHGRLLRAWDEIKNIANPRWAHRLISLEETAAAIHHFSTGIPAPLQTESYARAIMARGMDFYGGDLEEKVQFRKQRGSSLRHASPPIFSALIFEQALDLVVGTPEVMREQLDHLAEMSEKPHMHLRVIPNDGCGLVIHGHMSIIVPRSGKTPTLYTASFNRANFSTDPDELAWHKALFDHMQQSALTEEQSREFIVKLAEEKYPCAPPALP